MYLNYFVNAFDKLTSLKYCKGWSELNDNDAEICYRYHPGLTNTSLYWVIYKHMDFIDRKQTHCNLREETYNTLMCVDAQGKEAL